MTFRGAKGGSSSFKQTPDNLRSNDTFEGVLGLCVGGIKGPTRGLKSIKVDGTAIENENGELNFQDFTATVGDGDPLKFPQLVQLKLGAGAAPTQVGLSLPNEGGSNPIWITKTLSNTNADFIDMRFIVQQLFRQDDKGIYNLTATIEIQMKPTGTSTWINPTINVPTSSYNPNGLPIIGPGGTPVQLYLPEQNYGPGGVPVAGQQNYPITGKTSSPAVYELRIAVPNTGSYADTPWDIRARLLERESYEGGDNGTDVEKRSIQWESMAAVYGHTMGDHEDWQGLAWLQLYGKASDQLTGVPEITGEYDTKIVSVPTAAIYNPDTRVYTPGVWDGSWTKSFSNDPAWCISDVISDSLSGLSVVALGSYLNKWDALELSKWCSEMVPDGDGGTHPRYSMNIVVSQPQKAEEFIRYLGGAVGALLWDSGDGQWRCKVDKPDNAADIFTLDNIEGEFVYQHTDIDTRYNDVIGQFKNAEMDYRQDSVRLYDNLSIAQIGRKPTTVALVGCTNRQEAMRRIKLRIRSTVYENRIVTFTTNRRGRNIEPLSTILIADGDLGDQDKRTTGRMISISPDRKGITVRDPMYLAPGLAYRMWFTIPNPNYMPDTPTQPSTAEWLKPTISVSRLVTNTAAQSGAGVTVIYFDSPLPASVDMNLAIALEAIGLPTTPRLFRVTGISPGDDGERITITAINIDTDKWAASDNVSKEDTVFQDLRGAVPPATTVPGEPLLSLVRVPIEQGSQVNLQASWVRPPGAYISGFRVQYSVNGGALQTAVDRQQLTTWELPNCPPGTYHVEIVTIDRRGGMSLPLNGDLVVTQSLIDATQIKYTGGETLEDMKPAEPGADVTGNNTSNDTEHVGGRPAGTVLGKIDINTEAILQEALRQDDFEQVMDARTLIDGQSVGTVFLEFKNEVIGDNSAMASSLALLGAKNEDGTAWNLNLNTVKAGNVSLGTQFTNYTDAIGGLGFTVGGLQDQFGVMSQHLDELGADLGVTNAKVTTLQTAFASESQAVAESFSLLGAATADGSGWNLNVQHVLVGPISIAGKFDGLDSQLGALSTTVDTLGVQYHNTASQVTFLTEAFATDSDGYAQFSLTGKVDTQGRVNIVGVNGVANGVTSELNFIANNFKFTKPDGGAGVTLLEYSEANQRWEFTADLYAKHIVAGAIDFEFQGVESQSLNPAAGYQVLPGGFIIQWGQVRETLTGGSKNVVFPLPFPNALMSVTATPFVTADAANQDMWVQLTGNRSNSGFQVIPHAGPSGQHLNGFDWMAFGK